MPPINLRTLSKEQTTPTSDNQNNSNNNDHIETMSHPPEQPPQEHHHLSSQEEEMTTTPQQNPTKEDSCIDHVETNVEAFQSSLTNEPSESEPTAESAMLLSGQEHETLPEMEPQPEETLDQSYGESIIPTVENPLDVQLQREDENEPETAANENPLEGDAPPKTEQQSPPQDYDSHLPEPSHDPTNSTDSAIEAVMTQDDSAYAALEFGADLEATNAASMKPPDRKPSVESQYREGKGLDTSGHSRRARSHSLSDASLPSKKRKPNLERCDLSMISSRKGSVSSNELLVNLRKGSTGSSSSQQGSLSFLLQDSSSIATKNLICPSRLPSKKRKGSMDSQFTSSTATAMQLIDGKLRKDSTGSNNSSVGRKLSIDLSSNPSMPPVGPRKHRTDSLSSLDEALTRRKWSQDSTLSELSPSRRLMDAGAASSSLPKFDEILNAAPSVPDSLDEPISKLQPTAADAAAEGLMASSIMGVGESKETSSKTSVDEDTKLPPVSMTEATSNALDHLEALGDSSKPLGVAKKDDDTVSSGATFGSSGQKLLLEAIALTAGGGTTTGSGSQTMGGSNTGELGPRDRIESSSSQGLAQLTGTSRDRLESLGSALDHGGLLTNRRERLESWGGMSDLSGLHLGANFASGLSGGDLMMNIEEATLGDLHAPPPVASVAAPAPSASNSVRMNRERLGSLASLSDVSLTGLPVQVDGIDVTIDLQAFVSATVASMGNQLAEIAGAVELAAGMDEDAFLPDPDDDASHHHHDDSEVSSAASPMIGVSDSNSMTRHLRRQRPRSSSINSGVLSVDQEALAAAVDAANAAAASLDLANIGRESRSSSLSTETHQSDDQQKKAPHKKEKAAARRLRRQLPLTKRGHNEASISEMEEEQIRERARFAASAHIPDALKRKGDSKTKSDHKPLKKRRKRNSPDPDKANSNRDVDNAGAFFDPRAHPDDIASAPVVMTTPSPSNKLVKGDQKWDGMFEHLMHFIDSRREAETVGLAEEEKAMWIWDGNVPTNTKTTDGKALGRWVNNQRTAKSKGSLREERYCRLDEVGLRWCVMAPNFNETLQELRFYIAEQTKDGSEWDGNVPTNYEIKARPDCKFNGEDRRLGRWVNRQRSMYHSGKLQKDRQEALENIGLRWSMIESRPWDDMYQVLLQYIAEKNASERGWDGNVPSSYRTEDDPPKNLGRWVNRQRTNYAKKELKQDMVDKLEKVGLKWSVYGDARPSDRNEAEAPDAMSSKTAEIVVKSAEVDDLEPPEVSDTIDPESSSSSGKENLSGIQTLQV